MCELCLKLKRRDQIEVIDVFLLSLLLNLIIFHDFFIVSFVDIGQVNACLECLIAEEL